MLAAFGLVAATTDILNGRLDEALHKIDRARTAVRRAIGGPAEALRLVDAETWSQVVQGSGALLDAWSTQFEGEQDNTPAVVALREALARAGA